MKDKIHQQVIWPLSIVLGGIGVLGVYLRDDKLQFLFALLIGLSNLYFLNQISNDFINRSPKTSKMFIRGSIFFGAVFFSVVGAAGLLGLIHLGS